MTTLGIDPGHSGAFAWLDDDGELIDIADMPVARIGTKDRIVPALVADLICRRKVTMCWLEKVSTRPGLAAASVLTTGREAGIIEGALAALSVPTTLVTPAEWTKAMRAGADKGAHRQRACELWPGQSERFARAKDDGRADAALIAAHGYALRPIGRRVSADSAHRYHLDPKEGA